MQRTNLAQHLVAKTHYPLIDQQIVDNVSYCLRRVAQALAEILSKCQADKAGWLVFSRLWFQNRVVQALVEGHAEGICQFQNPKPGWQSCVVQACLRGLSAGRSAAWEPASFSNCFFRTFCVRFAYLKFHQLLAVELIMRLELIIFVEFNIAYPQQCM